MNQITKAFIECIDTTLSEDEVNEIAEEYEIDHADSLVYQLDESYNVYHGNAKHVWHSKKPVIITPKRFVRIIKYCIKQYDSLLAHNEMMGPLEVSKIIAGANFNYYDYVEDFGDYIEYEYDELIYRIIWEYILLKQKIEYKEYRNGQRGE